VRFDQAGFDVRCEWGLRGLRELEPVCDVVIIVDVLSFSTAVDIATARGALVYPYPRNDEPAAGVAAADRGAGYSLSPKSLLTIPRGYPLVLPSPNGSALSFAAKGRRVLTGCLRNASAVAAAASRLGSTMAVIPVGERWPTGEIRPSLEDLVGAGSIIVCLPGRKSPEAELAAAAFAHFRADLPAALQACGSGRELVERGFEADVELAGQYDVSNIVPVLHERAFRAIHDTLPSCDWVV
jgi:2-phosphosulfolactate phosphatase